MYICEKCGKKFEKDWRKDRRTPPRFCCVKCSNSKKHSEETKAKISSSLIKNKRFCKRCGKEISRKFYWRRYCVECNPFLTNEERENIIEKWKENIDVSQDISYSEDSQRSSFELSQSFKKRIKTILLEEQEHSCAICGISDNWFGREMIFILDHVDGDWKNHKKENLRLICPNCNSLLETTKHKKRGDGRYGFRRIKYGAISSVG